MTAKIQIRRDTTTNWGAGTPPTLAEGEIGLDTTLKQIKIGDNVNNWTALPWLSGTLPYYGTPSSTDLNDATNRIAGRYRFVSSATPSPTNGPFTFAALDGIATLLVTAYGDTIAQFLSTEGDGTPSFPSKNYFRLYDGGAAAWRAWMPLSNWATGAAVGTPIECTTVNAKGIVTIADGTVAAPAIAFASDTDTGFFWKAANQLGVSVGNNEVAYFTSTQFVADSVQSLGTSILTGACSMGSTLGVNSLATFTGGASLGAALAMGSNKITGLGNPTNAQDAVTKAYLEDTRIGSICFLNLQNTTVNSQQCGNSNAVTFTYASANLRAPAGTTWSGIIGEGSGAFAFGIVNDSSFTRSGGSVSVNGTGPLVNPGAYWVILTRTA